MSTQGEKKQTPHRTEKVVYGKHFDEVIKEVVEKLGANRVYAVISKSLYEKTGEGKKLEQVLGEKLVGKTVGVRSHTQWDDVLALTKDLQQNKVDLVVTLGAGSISDAVKTAVIAVANNAESFEDLDKLLAKGRDPPPNTKPPTISIVMIPTSLSSGEYNDISGATDPRDHEKKIFAHRQSVPKYIILDPWLAQTTPEWVYLSTGVRAIDHAVESLASLRSTPGGDKAASKALPRLVDALLRVKKDPKVVQARTDSQLGARLAITPVLEEGVPVGGSHGIGHMLGSVCDVPHGYTSCVMLPSVMRYNISVNKEKQEKNKTVAARR